MREGAVVTVAAAAGRDVTGGGNGCPLSRTSSRWCLLLHGPCPVGSRWRRLGRYGREEAQGSLNYSVGSLMHV